MDGTADMLIFALFEGHTGWGMKKGLVYSQRSCWETSQEATAGVQGNGAKWGHER